MGAHQTLQARPEPVPDDRQILVIEDSRTFSLALRQMLQAETGLPVTTCASLKEVSDLIVAAPGAYAIAVVDLNLPDAPRGEALDWTVTHGIPSVVFTATFDLATRGRIMEREVIDYVLKDNEFALPNLVGTVKRALNNRNTRILVVDDTRTTRKVLARMLSIQQYAVVEAGSGQEALTILESNPDIQLVVSDYYMPDMDGFELARRIRRHHPDVRVLGISSSTDRQTSAGFLKAGAHDFVSRPFVLEELQCRIASNVEVLDQLRQLQDLAARDFLTGLFNRRHFFARGRQLVSEAREMGLPISVAILDIDHFKRLNDRHGHDGGDKALTAVARTLGTMAERGFNLLARIGGEEFAIIFPGADLTEAERLCGDIRAAIAGSPLVINGETLPLTVSIGVAALTPDAMLETCLGQADEALYVAKQDGRDRVRTAA
ncbi:MULTISPECIES: diguanylate cyclase [Bosea]|jgi:diguanylate cyclase (GGDEF)-like protein|uniref:GGDEF domain-containing response regulator n=1 Tax=Bosea TaxID=85413 RepID=UPI00214F6191|nr:MULTISPECIES: diguanylate cyclase [Bosea]MCR4522781.1 diguanylate cyclase [Bosea sp. 47.2.35]MDR6826552.1 diguanylate cyclase (GGDEF)-like protein [Bosea robiniae]MDR6893262.1 diguanylate cyclase (GGDEF)-like protein [Bosea sp. BE109]MDR7137039.1 diguanylate cyclase (GGDEF)-like protein [Bosea sp. BE168]MDR7173738.1 diguanylate cyclase (GGDEF)-like protein [Bosea sp. BE271]